MVVVKILVFLVAAAIGILILKYTEPIVRTVGKMGWAEEHLGLGGTYTMWKIIGIVVILGGLVYVTIGW